MPVNTRSTPQKEKDKKEKERTEKERKERIEANRRLLDASAAALSAGARKTLATLYTGSPIRSSSLSPTRTRTTKMSTGTDKGKASKGTPATAGLTPAAGIASAAGLAGVGETKAQREARLAPFATAVTVAKRLLTRRINELNDPLAVFASTPPPSVDLYQELKDGIQLLMAARDLSLIHI